jgi:trans-2,3-dihydro-3-hydroxyanthranilate isomerase
METTQVLLVDAFADEPMGGVPIPVVPEAVSESQLRTIAGEFGATAAVSLGESELLAVERTEGTVVEAAVAGCVGLGERDMLDDGTHTLTVRTDGADTEYDIELGADRDVRVQLPQLELSAADTEVDRLAPALGVDVAALADVGADLPVGRLDGFGGTLFVPVNFLEHLGNASPDAETLAAVLAAAEATRVCAFTFDTLGRETDMHARIFDTAAEGCERPASGVAIAGCGQHLVANEIFDGERAVLRAECGQFLDRPGTVVTTLDARPSVGGRGLTALDGSLTVPEDDSDDIIEA